MGGIPQVVSLEQRLVEVGVELLESEGPDRLGLREIARRAGVSHGAPRRYFPAHTQLLGAIAKVGLTDLVRTLEEALASEGPVVERVVAAAHAYVGFAQRRPEMFRLMFRHDLLRDSGYRLREGWLPLLGSLEQLVPRERVLLLWTHMHGIATFAADSTLEPTGFGADFSHLVEQAVRGQLA